MFKSDGLFDSFDNLDQIDPANLIGWVKPAPQLKQIENYLGNRVLYPQTITYSETDIKFDLAILREALRISAVDKKTNQISPLLGDNPFFNFTLRKVIIPANFLEYIPDLTTLAWVFADVLILIIQKKDWFEDLWTVVLSGDIDEIVGSILLPQFGKKGTVFELISLGKSYKIGKGSLTVIPCSSTRCEISYKFDQGNFLGKVSSTLEIYGGRLGLVVDGRRQ